MDSPARSLSSKPCALPRATSLALSCLMAAITCSFTSASGLAAFGW